MTPLQTGSKKVGRRQGVVQGHPLAIPVLLLALAAAGTGQALAAELQPYQARYSTTALGLDMTLTRNLTREGDDYTLTSQGSVFLASLEEVARFTLDGNRIRGQEFSYRLKGLVNRRREVQFLPGEGIIRSLRKKEWTVHPWDPQVLDRLSQQEQLRLELMRTPEPPSRLTFSVIDGPRVRERTLELVGEETLDTRLGPLRTLHYARLFDQGSDRASDIWIAPELDYLMVLTRHLEGSTRIEIELIDTTLTVEGQDTQTTGEQVTGS